MSDAPPLAEPAPLTVPVDAPPSSASGPCAACGERLAGPFCHGCGERAVRPGDESLAAFLREQFHEVTSADGRLWRSIRGLFVPGKLTEEYLSGRRGLYVRPVRIFLASNLVFFLALGAMNASSSIFAGTAETYRSWSGLGEWAGKQIDTAAAREGAGVNVFEAAFNQRSATLANSLVILMVPMFAFVLSLVLIWRRASGVRHLVCATHVLAFAMAGSVATAIAWVPLVSALSWAGWIPPGHWLLYSMDPILGVVVIVYIALALRRVYSLGWGAAVAVSGAVFLVGAPVVTGGYRLALFAVALWTTDVST